MNITLQPLTDEDRAELCSRVDFLAVLQEDGVELKEKAQGHHVGKLRDDEKTASFHVWEPGKGKLGRKGFTYHDFGDDERSGDALAYFMAERGLDFPGAVREMAERVNWWPEGWQAENGQKTTRKAPTKILTAAYSPPQPTGNLSIAAQSYAACALLADLEVLDANAAKAGVEYLRNRGCLPPGAWNADPPFRGVPIAWGLSREAAGNVSRSLAADTRRADIEAAGLLTEKGKIPWWGPAVLFACHTPDLRPVSIVARRTDHKPGDKVGKYMNQPTPEGFNRHPWGLPAVYRHPGWLAFSREKRDELLIVEGIMDALGAAVLGWPAVAVFTRPGAGEIDARHGNAHALLADHLPALREFRTIRVVPDNDEGEKGEVGAAKAAKLVGWLRNADCRAELATVPELCPNAPDNTNDLADVAAAISQ